MFGLSQTDFDAFNKQLQQRRSQGRELFIDSTVAYDMQNPVTCAVQGQLRQFFREVWPYSENQVSFQAPYTLLDQLVEFLEQKARATSVAATTCLGSFFDRKLTAADREQLDFLAGQFKLLDVCFTSPENICMLLDQVQVKHARVSECMPKIVAVAASMQGLPVEVQNTQTVTKIVLKN